MTLLLSWEGLKNNLKKIVRRFFGYPSPILPAFLQSPKVELSIRKRFIPKTSYDHLKTGIVKQAC
jgi:hypothetical protein